MNNICFDANREANYVFHMLSVARCGYDNEYGAAYRGEYPSCDLDAIKRREELLTVCGGAHFGALFGLMVSQAACGRVSAKEYYEGLIRVSREINAGNIPNYVDRSVLSYNDTIIELSEIMVRHYDRYVADIWRSEKKKLNSYIAELSGLFDCARFTEKAEKLVGCGLDGQFTAILVSSIAGGAEAIDISDRHDVFGIDRPPADAFWFIGHEYIIFLLKKALSGLNAFKDFKTWGLTEGLAEYYIEKLGGNVNYFADQRQYIDFYERSEKDEASAAELYKAASERFL